MLYLAGEDEPRRFDTNVAVITGLKRGTFYSASVSGLNGFLEGELSSIVTQKTRIEKVTMARYIAFDAYAKGTTESSPTITNARVYSHKKYLATGMITDGAVNIYMTGIVGANYARKVALVVNDIEQTSVTVNFDGTFRYYAKDKVTRDTDVVKVLLYNQGSTVMDTLEVTVSALAGKKETESGSTVNNYKLGADYVTGTYMTDFIVKPLDGRSSAPDAIEGMPTILPIELPKLILNAINSTDKIVSGVTEPNAYVRVNVDGVARSVPQANEAGVFSIVSSSIVAGSVVKVESKNGSNYPHFVTVSAT